MLLKKIILSIAVLFLAMTQLAATEEYQHGAYGLLAVGRGYNNFSAANFTANPTYSDNSWAWAGRLAMGYNIDKYIGIEVGGRYFRQRKFSGIANSPYDGFADLQDYTAHTVIRWPFSEGYNLFVKFGPAFVIAEQSSSASTAQATTSGNKTTSSKEWEPMYSLGASMRLDDFPGAELMVEYSMINADKDNYLPKSELYAVGFVFHF
jgi:hypothetical protein